MSEKPEQAAKDADEESGAFRDRRDTETDRGHAPDAPDGTDQRQFSDFALI